MQYDLIIIGTGPAGYTASIYASRYRVKHAVVGEMPGGLMSESHKICNYPSEVEISGFDLMSKIQAHVEHLGAPIIFEKVLEIKKIDGGFSVKTSGQELSASNILIATGTKHIHLELPGEKKLLGKGLSYCATCDAMFYKDKVVGVVGGANSAVTAALYLSEVATKVYQFVRGPKLKGETIWIEQLLNKPNVQVVYGSNVTEILGEERLSGIKVDVEVNGSNELSLDGLFLEIGTAPDEVLIDQLDLAVDEKGYIKVDAAQKTNIEGVWAAGDATTGSNNFRQIVTACSEGAIAAENIFKFIQSSKK